MKGINGVNFSKKEFIELIGKVFLPILIIVIIVGIALWLYSKHAEKKGIKGYNNKINFHASLISIVITLVLLAITVIFSVNFINVMNAENLIESNKMVYYIVIVSPLIPFAFLIYLITRLVKSMMANEEEIKARKIEEEQENVEKEEFTNGIVDTDVNKKDEPVKEITKNGKEDVELL